MYYNYVWCSLWRSDRVPGSLSDVFCAAFDVIKVVLQQFRSSWNVVRLMRTEGIVKEREFIFHVIIMLTQLWKSGKCKSRGICIVRVDFCRIWKTNYYLKWIPCSSIMTCQTDHIKWILEHLKLCGYLFKSYTLQCNTNIWWFKINFLNSPR